MPNWQLFYLVVWATKNHEPLLTPDVGPVIHDWLCSKSVGLGASLFSLSGVPDHVHMFVAIPYKIPAAKFIGHVKAVASTKFNKSGLGAPPFFWQAEYGVFSFDAKRLLNFIRYEKRQKEHHAQ